MGMNKIGFPGIAPLPSNINLGQNSTTQNIQQLYGNQLPIALPPAETYLIPQGQYIVTQGLYTCIQYYDTAVAIWRNLRAGYGPHMLSSDGANYRLANLSGCPVGAIVTAGGANASNVAGFYPAATTNGIAPNSAYTCVASAGGSTWNFWVGGAVQSSPTITAGGTLYTVAPVLVVMPPANQGSTPYIPATMTCTISAGAINAVTVTNQGAGYVAAPTVLVVNVAGDITGNGGIITATIGNSTAVTGVVMASPGTVRTAVPTLTITTPGGSPTATVVMNFALTAPTVSAGGAAYGNAQPFTLLANGGLVTTAPIYTNPSLETNLTTPRQPYITGTSTAGGAVTATGLVIQDAGMGYQLIPGLVAVAGGGNIPTTGATFTVAVGGVSDVAYLGAI
jgi:hypothetical protein